MSKDEEILKAIDRNTKAIEELTKSLRGKDEKPRDPAQPEGTTKLKG